MRSKTFNQAVNQEVWLDTGLLFPERATIQLLRPTFKDKSIQPTFVRHTDGGKSLVRFPNRLTHFPSIEFKITDGESTYEFAEEPSIRERAERKMEWNLPNNKVFTFDQTELLDGYASLQMYQKYNGVQGTFVGLGTGSIIASSLALGFSFRKIEKFFEEDLRKAYQLNFFQAASRLFLASFGFKIQGFSVRKLHRILKSYYDGATVGDCNTNGAFASGFGFIRGDRYQVCSWNPEQKSYDLADLITKVVGGSPYFTYETRDGNQVWGLVDYNLEEMLLQESKGYNITSLGIRPKVFEPASKVDAFERLIHRNYRIYLTQRIRMDRSYLGKESYSRKEIQMDDIETVSTKKRDFREIKRRAHGGT